MKGLRMLVPVFFMVFAISASGEEMRVEKRIIKKGDPKCKMGEMGEMGKMHGKKGMEGIPGLTQDQMKKLKDIKINHEKEIIPLKAQAKIKHIELQQLIEANSDEGAIFAKIDEVSKIKADIKKKDISSKMAANKIFTPEQKKWIAENKPMEGMKMKCKMMGGPDGPCCGMGGGPRCKMGGMEDDD